LSKKIKFILYILCLILLFILIGCRGDGNNDTALNEYQAKMEFFYEHLNSYDRDLNELDPEKSTAVTDMLSYLDGIAALVKTMASYKVPEVFVGVEELAKQADEYMTEAVRLYREAFTASEYDDNIAKAAQENFERANLRLRYIADILRGEIPEGLFSN